MIKKLLLTKSYSSILNLTCVMNHLKLFKKMAMVVLVTMVGAASKLNAQTCPTSDEVTITIVAEPTITTSGDVTVCVGGGGTITSTPAGGAGTCVIRWEKRTGGSTGTWATIASNANETISGNNLVVANVAETTEYRAFYECDGVGCDAQPSNITTVTVMPDLAIQSAIADRTICVGGDGTLTFNVTGGTGTISYEWQVQNGTNWDPAPGANATSNTYVADNTTPGTKRYRVRATATGNDCNATTFSEATVTVVEDMVLTMSNPIIECIGSNQQLTVTIQGGINPTIVWQESNSATGPFTDVSPAQTGTTFTPPNAAANVGTKFYQAVVTSTGSGCAAPTPIPVRVQVLDVISVTAQPEPIVECVGGNQTLTPTLTGISGAVEYQWQVSDDGNAPWDNVAGATAATFTPPNAQANVGVKHYRLAVRHTGSDCQDVYSLPTRVEVVPDLSLSADIADIVECIDGNQPLTIVVAGGSNLTYNWEVLNGTTWEAAPGASTASNTYVPPSNVDGTKRYRVRVSSASQGCEAITSREANVTVNPDISITTPVAGFTECIGGTQALSVVATGGTSPLSYQWYEVIAGTPTIIAGQTSTSFTPESTTAGTRTYQVRIRSANHDPNASPTDGCGDVFSTPVTVTVVPRPVVTVSVPPAAICVGGTVTLTATQQAGTGTGTCTFQWQRPDAGGVYQDVPGETNPTYTIPTNQTGAAGEIKVKAKLVCSGNGCCN
jgi:hypothetical protein